MKARRGRVLILIQRLRAESFLHGFKGGRSLLLPLLSISIRDGEFSEAKRRGEFIFFRKERGKNP